MTLIERISLHKVRVCMAKLVLGHSICKFQAVPRVQDYSSLSWECKSPWNGLGKEKSSSCQTPAAKPQGIQPHLNVLRSTDGIKVCPPTVSHHLLQIHHLSEELLEVTGNIAAFCSLLHKYREQKDLMHYTFVTLSEYNLALLGSWNMHFYWREKLREKNKHSSPDYREK